MSRFWRGIAIAAAVCGFAAAGAGPALAQTTQTPVVTISAKSPLPVVTHDVFVLYKHTAQGLDTVTISGSVSESTDGQVAALYAQPFPYKLAPAPVAGQTLALTTSATPTTYSFTAKPTIATRYTVDVLPSSSVSTPFVGASATTTVYVVTNQTGSSTKCRRPVCHLTLHIFTHLPKSAYNTESRKKWYFYFAVKLSRSGEPSFPKWLNLKSKAKISKVKKISSTEFERTITWSFRINNDGFAYGLNFCSKDTESKDGINLPGKHSCGANRVHRTAVYLG